MIESKPLSGADPRYYFLPLGVSCSPHCGVCAEMGCRNHEDRDLPAVFRLISRAKSGGFSGVSFPASFLEHGYAPQIFEKCRACDLDVVLQIHWPALQGSRDGAFRWAQRGVHLNIVFNGAEDVDGAMLSEIARASRSWHITINPGRRVPLVRFLEKFPSEFRDRVHFHFSPYGATEHSMSVKQVFDAINRIQRDLPGFPVRPPRGQEVWDPRISPLLGLDSDVAPTVSYSLDESPEISVIIPSYNSAPLLKNAIRHLLWQDVPRSRFEIIVVDDGSTDGSTESVRNFMAPEAGQVNFKYIYFPRARERRRGDKDYRAGIARNIGAKHARGKILAFLDADIIVPTNYLADVVEKLKSADVVQAVRLHLNNQAQNEFVEYSAVDQARDTYVFEEKYWGPFFRVQDWSALPFFWKYTCTYSLSLTKENFMRAGWFLRTFVYYGFEDTELGYRLAQLNLKFLLNPLVTYHLASKDEDRTEYRQSKFERHLVLSKTAKVFFLNSLDPEVFLHFRFFMGGEISLLDLPRRAWALFGNLPIARKLRPATGGDGRRGLI